MTFNEMSFSEKVDHIWEYYKLQIIGSIVGIFVIFSFLNIWVFNPEPENVVDITFRTTAYNYEREGSLQEELNAAVIDEGVNETVMLEFLATGDMRDPATVQASEAKFIGKIQTGDIDLVVVEDEWLERMTNPMAFYDINELEATYGFSFPEEMKVYGVDAETGKEGAYALSVNQIPGLYEMTGQYEGVRYYVGVFIRSENLEKTLKTLEYLVNQ